MEQASKEKSLSSRISFLVSSVMGVGLAPKMPGTLGSAAGAAVFLLSYFFAGPLLSWGVLSALVLGGVLASERSRGEEKDPGFIVIDEAAGMFAALLFLRRITPVHIIALFALFRFFDIRKPFFIKTAERLRGGLGIMADDLAASFFSVIVYRAVLLVLGQ